MTPRRIKLLRAVANTAHEVGRCAAGVALLEERLSRRDSLADELLHALAADLVYALGDLREFDAAELAAAGGTHAEGNAV